MSSSASSGFIFAHDTGSHIYYRYAGYQSRLNAWAIFNADRTRTNDYHAFGL